MEELNLSRIELDDEDDDTKNQYTIINMIFFLLHFEDYN